MKITARQLKRIIKEELAGVESFEDVGSLESDLKSAIDGLVLETRNRFVNESILKNFLSGLLDIATLKIVRVAMRDAALKIKEKIDEMSHDAEVIELREIEEKLMKKVSDDQSLIEMLKEYEETKDSQLSKDISAKIANITKQFAKELGVFSRATAQSPQKIRSKMRTGRRFSNLDVY